MRKRMRAALVAAMMCAATGMWGAELECVDYVNPYIGNISHLLVPTFPTIQLPNSLMRIYPTRGDYTSERLEGLPVVVTNHRERSAFRISVTQGTELKPIISTSWDQERVTPYSYYVQIADNTIDVSLAVSHQSAIYDFEFSNPDQPATVVLCSDNGKMNAQGSHAEGYQQLSSSMRIFFSGEFSVKPIECGVLRDGEIQSGQARAEGRQAEPPAAMCRCWNVLLPVPALPVKNTD